MAFLHPDFHHLAEIPLVGFVRVSTANQERFGSSLATQENRIRKFADIHGAKLVSIHGGAASGMGRERHLENRELAAAIAMARQVGGALVVTEVSRLGRDDQLFEILKELDIPVISLDLGRVLTEVELQRGLKAAKKYGLTIGPRTSGTLARAKAAGKQLGNPNVKTMSRDAAVKNSAEAEAHAEDVAEVLSGMASEIAITTLKAKAVFLNSAGRRTRQGKEWTAIRLRDHQRYWRDRVNNAEDLDVGDDL